MVRTLRSAQITSQVMPRPFATFGAGGADRLDARSEHPVASRARSRLRRGERGGPQMQIFRWRAALAALALAFPALAKVTSFNVDHRLPFAGGASWGNAGPYEKLTGIAFMEVDPRDPLNAGIVDLDRAPRN